MRGIPFFYDRAYVLPCDSSVIAHMLRSTKSVRTPIQT